MKSISEWIPDAEQLKMDSNCKEVNQGFKKELKRLSFSRPPY